MPNRRRFLALATLASSAGLPFLSACTSGTKQTDVVIIGAGHSGLAAAVSAAQQGAKVTVIEKRPFVGLNTHSDRGFFCVEPFSERFAVIRRLSGKSFSAVL